MILSKKHKFLYIKGRKVASTSMEVMLSAICGSEDIITPITPIDELQRLKSKGRSAQNYGADEAQLDEYLKKLLSAELAQVGEMKAPKGNYNNHMSYSRIKNLYGEIPDDYLVFAVDRCPYRKLISKANMKLNFQKYKKSGTQMTTSPEDIKAQISEIIETDDLKTVKNINLYRDKSGKLMAKILKYENLAAEIDRLMAELNISDYPKMEHLKKGLSSNNLDLNDYFTKEQIKIINDEYHDEFEAYGYEML